MAIEGKAKVVLYEVLGAFILILLMVVLRPLFVGQVASAGTPYNITVTDSSTGVTSQQTITPSGTLSTAQTDTLYTIAIFVVVIVALFVIVLTMLGKL